VGRSLEFELDWLLKLRLVVARHGEHDQARWWNSAGQLGTGGAGVLRRGFPRTHYFAQARSVFAAASSRCLELFSLGDAVTLWRLEDEIEEAFDQRWEEWLDNAGAWSPFFQELAANTNADLRAALLGHGLVSAVQVENIDKLSVDSSGQSIRVGENSSPAEITALLALGFAKGAPGKLVVPHAMASR
jgi:hypothetical protein